jgi:hypothetical protein
MRLGRLLLASLTALAAYSYAQAAPQPANAHESLRILQVVVPMLAHAADSVSPAPVVKSAPHSIFLLDALKATPLSGSLFLLASLIAIDLITRRSHRTLLRC